MDQAGIQGAHRRERVRTTRRDRGAGRHPDLVKRAFVADAPNRLWVTDLVRHGALWTRMGVRDLHRLAVAAAGLKLRAA